MGGFCAGRLRAAGHAVSAERRDRPVGRFGLDPPGGPAAAGMAGEAGGAAASSRAKQSAKEACSATLEHLECGQ